MILQCSYAKLRFRGFSAGCQQLWDGFWVVVVFFAISGAGEASAVGGGQSSLLQSVHRIRSRSGKKPEPTSDTEQREHLKHGWCHCRSSKETYFPSPNPA